MHWERREDCHNLVVSAMMTKTEFLECKRYLHLADNNTLNSSDKSAKVRPLFNVINEQCILNYQLTQHVSVHEPMVPHFGKHGAKHYIHGKPMKFGFKLWVFTTPLGYCIQFRPYPGKDSILQEYENIGLVLDASVVAKLVSKLPMIQTCNCHIVMDNYFASPALLRNLSTMGVAATGTVRANRMENALLRDMVNMKKEKRGSSDVVTDVFSNINVVRWKDNKVVKAISTFTAKQQFQQAKRYCKDVKELSFLIFLVIVIVKTESEY